MLPRKLISSIGVIITTLITIILFITQLEQVKGFFFPKNRSISLPLLIFSIIGFGLLVFYITYIFYHKEKEKLGEAKLDLQNIKLLLYESERLRLIDDITGIPNQDKFEIDINDRPRELFHMIFIDLDGFSKINKKKGFQVGDKIIRTIAQDLSTKMRRDEEIYKREVKQEKSFVKRIYRKYRGGDEFIFLIKGDQYEAVGFITRAQKQLEDLVFEYNYKIRFHGAVVKLHPNDKYEHTIKKLQKASVQAAEEKDNLRVYWDSEEEKKFSKDYGGIYDKARKAFKVKK